MYLTIQIPCSKALSGFSLWFADPHFPYRAQPWVWHLGFHRAKMAIDGGLSLNARQRGEVREGGNRQTDERTDGRRRRSAVEWCGQGHARESDISTVHVRLRSEGFRELSGAFDNRRTHLTATDEDGDLYCFVVFRAPCQRGLGEGHD